MIIEIFITFSLSFTICYIIIKSFRLHARLTSDYNDGPQKVHNNTTPRIGGVAIYVAMIVFCFLTESREAKLLMLSSLPAFISGLSEDLTKKVKALNRLILIAISPLIAIYFLESYLNRSDIPIIDELFKWKAFSMAFTVFAVTGVTNAFNIIDGFNGLSSGVAIIVLGAIALVSNIIGDEFIYTIAIAMCFCILGFMLWNWPKGRIFLGDGGAYFIGFIIAELSVLLVIRNEEVSAWFPMVLVLYPVVETLFSIYRRKFVNKISPTKPDSFHLHTLLYKHITNKNSATSPLLWLISLSFSIPAILFFRNTAILVFLTLLFVFIYLKIYNSIAVLEKST